MKNRISTERTPRSDNEAHCNGLERDEVKFATHKMRQGAARFTSAHRIGL
jgi:hypothetical protein